MKTIALLTAVLPLCFLTACEDAKVAARQNLDTSAMAYRSCVSRHLNTMSACSGARLAYQTNLNAYRATGGEANDITAPAPSAH